MNFYKIANIAAALGAGAGKNGHKSKEEHKADRLAIKDAANDMPCVNEGADAMCCIHQKGNNNFAGCAGCIMKLFEDVPEGTDDICAYLLEKDQFCQDMMTCFYSEDHCNYEACEEDVDAYLMCEVEEIEDPCPGLCEDHASADFLTMIA